MKSRSSSFINKSAGLGFIFRSSFGAHRFIFHLNWLPLFWLVFGLLSRTIRIEEMLLHVHGV